MSLIAYFRPIRCSRLYVDCKCYIAFDRTKNPRRTEFGYVYSLSQWKRNGEIVCAFWTISFISITVIISPPPQLSQVRYFNSTTCLHSTRLLDKHENKMNRIFREIATTSVRWQMLGGKKTITITTLRKTTGYDGRTANGRLSERLCNTYIRSAICTRFLRTNRRRIINSKITHCCCRPFYKSILYCIFECSNIELRGFGLNDFIV